MRTNITFIAIISAALLSGCQTATELQKGSSGGLQTMASCEQIQSTFNAYQQDRQSIDALRQIAGITNTNIQSVTPDTVANYYPLIKNTINVALLVKGCQPLM